MTWLVSLALLGQVLRQEYVRVTYYTLVGVTASGEWTHTGVAACSDWLPLGTRLAFTDGFVVTCLDRGLGGKYWRAWVDVWVDGNDRGRREVTERYGDYTWVSVIGPGSDSDGSA